MSQTSPILRFSLEVFHTALEHYTSDRPRHRKLAILGFAQAVELTIKAALVEQNVPIYQKGGRTINSHDALVCLASLWDVDRIQHHARVELLVDERNAIQHRYGNVDDVSLDYHLETAFEVVSRILQSEFDTDLEQWVRDTVDESIWKLIRFVGPGIGEASESEEPSDAVVAERSPVVDFVAGFSSFERSIRVDLSKFLGEHGRFSGSTLDYAIKALSNTEPTDQDLIGRLPNVYRMRNRSVHGDTQPSGDEVRAALQVLDRALEALGAVPQAVKERAAKATVRGVRGTKLPSYVDEPRQDEFADSDVGEGA